MSMRKVSIGIFGLLVYVAANFAVLGEEGGAVQDHQGFGVPATAVQIERSFWTVFPDGEFLPGGGGTAEDGAPIYAEHCESCHGRLGNPGGADVLFGRGPKTILTVGNYWPYATTVFDYIRRAMPYDAPMSLSTEEYYALTAFILSENGIIDARFRVDGFSLPTIEMPNANGFVVSYPGIPQMYRPKTDVPGHKVD